MWSLAIGSDSSPIKTVRMAWMHKYKWINRWMLRRIVCVWFWFPKWKSDNACSNCYHCFVKVCWWYRILLQHHKTRVCNSSFGRYILTPLKDITNFWVQWWRYTWLNLVRTLYSKQAEIKWSQISPFITSCESHKDKMFTNTVHVHFNGEFDDWWEQNYRHWSPAALQLRYRRRLEWGVDTSKKKGPAYMIIFSDRRRNLVPLLHTEPKIPSNFRELDISSLV